MSLPPILRRRLAVGLLGAALLCAAACGADPTPTPTATPAPTPTPTPALTVETVLSSAAAQLAGLTSATLTMADETETGALFFNQEFKDMEAAIEAPASVDMRVNVVSPAFGFVTIAIIAVGEQAFMKFSADAPWAPIPPSQVPFNFVGLGGIISAMIPKMQDAALSGREAVDGAQTIRVDGAIMSEDLSELILTASPGHPIDLTLWVDEANYELRRLRITGKVFDDDGDGTRRLIEITGFNVPVDISLPAAGS